MSIHQEIADAFETYVAESNLTTDDNIDPVDHPFVDIFFYEYDNSGQYSLKQTFN